MRNDERKPKYKEKVKNDGLQLSRQRLTFVKGTLFGAVIMVALFSFLRISDASIHRNAAAESAGDAVTSVDETRAGEETLTVPFAKLAPTLTQKLYSGTIQLTISGYGQAAGNDYSDAFYLYTRNGQTLDTPLTEMFDLEIDGNRAIYMLGLQDNPPAYNSAHEYILSYDVGITPRSIAFRISDSNVEDNSGEFVIVIRTQS